MTPYEEELLTRYLTHLNIQGENGDFADFKDWYQLVRYANANGAPEEVPELRYRDVLEAARVFNRLQTYHPEHPD